MTKKGLRYPKKKFCQSKEEKIVRENYLITLFLRFLKKEEEVPLGEGKARRQGLFSEE